MTPRRPLTPHHRRDSQAWRVCRQCMGTGEVRDPSRRAVTFGVTSPAPVYVPCPACGGSGEPPRSA